MERDFSLFPKNEEWGTGDEALDQKLNLALKKAQSEFTTLAIADFYELAHSLNRRAYNPSFLMLIELVTKALLHLQRPGENVYDLMNKMKGHYDQKERVVLQFPEQSKILNELLAKNHYRYNGQLDFSFHQHSPQERNPFLKETLYRGNHILQVKIIFKELKSYFNGELESKYDNDPLLKALAERKSSIIIEGLAELWYDQGQIFALSEIKY